MDDDSTRQSVLFSDLAGKAVVAKFDQDHASSDGGAILLQACDRRLGLTDALIGGIDDRRQSGKIRHAIGDLVRQRLYAIACGYPDGNDAGRLGADPIQKLLCGRDPVRGEDLASQPTLSRFENAFDRTDLFRMGIALADTVIERHRRRLKRKVKRITIDLDPTDDPTHGAQQLTFFNGHYDTWCYLPVAGFLTFNEEPDQYLFAYVLRPGNASAGVGAIGILSRVLPRLRAAFPRARLRVRLDGGFAAAEMFAFLEREGLEYVVAMGKNKVLERRAARLMGTARRLSRESGETEHLYSQTRYAAGTWDQRRRVIIKAEVVRHPGRKPKDNPRFVVTNLKHSPPASVRSDLLRPRGHRESDQRAASWPGNRPHQLQPLPRQSIAGAVERRRLRALPGAASAGRPHRLQICPGQHPARTPHETRRMGRVFRAAHRAAPARHLSASQRLADHRPQS
jgi:hypothetical protein